MAASPLPQLQAHAQVSARCARLARDFMAEVAAAEDAYAQAMNKASGTLVAGLLATPFESTSSTQRQVLESFAEVQSCAAQLPQTAHHALQLPYTIFGLGLAPNFLDFVYVNVTNTSAVSQSKIWPQVNK